MIIKKKMKKHSTWIDNSRCFKSVITKTQKSSEFGTHFGTHLNHIFHTPVKGLSFNIKVQTRAMGFKNS